MYKLLLRYNYDGNGQLSSVEYDGTTYLYKVNQFGDVLGLYNTSGTLVVKYLYDPWGKLVRVTDQNGNTITGAESVALRNPFRYRGYYYDTDTGWYYLNSRYYDPETGRFINADGYASTGQGIIGCNMYAYCENNPVIRIDTSGQLWGIIALVAVGVVVVAAGITAAITVANSAPASSSEYATMDAAAAAWKNDNASRDQSKEHGAFIYEKTNKKTKEKTYTYGRTYSGGKNNIIRGVVVGYAGGGASALVSSKKKMVGFIHSHPTPSEGRHNDYLSPPDLFLKNLPGIQEVYMVPSKRCDGMPEIMSTENAVIWDSEQHRRNKK